MKRALLIAALVTMTALAASADIRRFMQVKGYSSFITGACTTGCGSGAITPQDTISEPVAPNASCTFPATMPCTFGG